MKFYAFITVLLAYSAVANRVTFEGYDYQIEKVGRKYFVVNAHIVVTAHDISGLQKNDCAQLAEDIVQSERNFDICERAPESSMCRLLKDDVVHRSKEENFQRPVVLSPRSRSWSISSMQPNHDDESIKEHVATTLGVNKNDVIVKRTFSPGTGVPNIVIAPGSLLQKVTRIVPVTPGFLDPPRIVNDKLVVNNRMLACDLENRAVQIHASFPVELAYTEAITEEQLDAIWSVYQDLLALTNTEQFKDLPAIIQGARIGREIGLAIHNTPMEEDFGFERLLYDLFIINENRITLKAFDTKEDLREKQYPVEHFLKQVDVPWSLP